MKLSTRGRYGARLMLELASRYQHGPVHLNEIAQNQDISLKYLEQLIIPLKKSDYIHSVRGPRGGYQLKPHPGQVTIGEIVQLLEGDLELTPCLKNPENCTKAGDCPTKDVWDKATQAMYRELNSVTLLDLLQKKAPGLDRTLRDSQHFWHNNVQQ